MSKTIALSKNVFTNMPKGKSRKCSYKVGIIVTKFASLKISKILLDKPNMLISTLTLPTHII